MKVNTPRAIEALARSMLDWSIATSARAPNRSTASLRDDIPIPEKQLLQTVAFALLEAALATMHGTRKERQLADYAFAAGLSIIDWLVDYTEPELVAQVAERDEVQRNTAWLGKVYITLVRFPRTRFASFERLLRVELDSSALTTRDFLLNGVLDEEEDLQLPKSELITIARIVFDPAIRWSSRDAKKSIKKKALAIIESTAGDVAP